MLENHPWFEYFQQGSLRFVQMSSDYDLSFVVLVLIQKQTILEGYQ